MQFDGLSNPNRMIMYNSGIMALRKKNKSRKPQVFLFFVLLMTLLVARWSWSNYQTYKQAQDMLSTVELRQANTQERLEKVEARNELLETETGVQDFLVEKYAIKREGERVLVLVRDEDEVVVEQEDTEDSFWGRMKKTFFE